MPTTVSFGNTQTVSNKLQSPKPHSQPLATLNTPQDSARFGKGSKKQKTNPAETNNTNDEAVQDKTPVASASTPPEAAVDAATPSAQPEAGEETKKDEAKPAAEASNGNWFTKRAKTILPGLGAFFHGGEGFSPFHWPFKGWKTDLVQSTLVTLPLTLLPGSQLIMIPLWLALGGAVRSTFALGRGLIKPDAVLQEIKEKKAEAEAKKNS